MKISKLRFGHGLRDRATVFFLLLVLQPFSRSYGTKIFYQERVISGVVTDVNDIPLPGASIRVKGTSSGTTASFDGDFTITVPDGYNTLVISYMGFLTREMDITGNDRITIRMEEDTQSLDEVVVVGYGTQKKKDLVGAISSVKSEELILASTPSVGQALQGKVSGLQIVQNSAQPGGGLDFLIRGAASINASNQPLIVVDGFPITDFQQPDSGNRYDGGTQGILNSFNPNDIESIDVLKDASSTAIYGARAANGVILITTKKGKAGKVSVDYSASYSFQDYINNYEVLPLQEWMQLRNEATYERWAFQNRVAPYSDRTLEEAIADPVNGVPFKRYYSDEEIANAGKGTDWLGLVTRDGSIQQHNLSVRGGTEKTTYFLSGNFYDQKGVIKNSGFERSSLRINIDHTLNKYVKFGLNLTTSTIKNQNSQLGGDQFENSGIIRSALQQSPYIPAIDENGNYPINPDNALEPNPYSLLTVSDEGSVDRTLGNFYAEVKPIPGLTARMQIGFDKGFSSRNTYLPRTTLHGAQENGRASIANGKKNDKLLDLTLNYSVEFGEDHSLNLLAGYSRQKYHSEGSSSGNSDFLSDAFLWNNLNAGAGTKVVGSYKSENNLASFFGRINYVYKDRYIFTSTFRRDGSSVFSKNNRFGSFPSVAIGWDISKEPFMEGWSDQVSQFKLRIGYGETGNADIGGNARAAYYPQPSWLDPDESILIGVLASRLENPDLKWETTKEINVGLDFGLLDQRINGSVEVFSKEISDLLMEKPINSYHEVNMVWANIGKTQSKGVEVTLNADIIRKEDLIWRSTLTYSRYRDRWKERAEDFKPAVYQNDQDPIRARYMYLSDGIMQEGEVVEAQPELLPGMIKLKDVNGFVRDDGGDPVVDENGRFLRTGGPDGRIDEADVVLLGSTDPDFIGGFSNMIRYKNFELSFNFNGMFGRKIIDQTDFTYGVSAEGVAANGRNALREVLDRWTPENPSTSRPASHYGDSRYDSGDFFLQDAWFIRLQNLSLSYRMPTEWFGKYLSDASIRIGGQNLFLITPYDGIDPETDAYTAAYPNVRSYTIGIDLKF
ncbi:SusC/RagA family TonB-linked outer membrane protein [Sinomicrobium soli]|uniref:SusC/RagA family TonB-linked outer membrane protein n=1 Tax=Sinomicrobium sp. N-1-3-6 TaxID=2219864 RepID=UPI000DCDD13D|nr:TonB-dependent receptor [Sinomicrobium sp. N-1-3-6]RAV27951.1 SusC/RagA family TonB-linked outer membrane protein [Sinomicrobium sp. N-1-3-6]